MRSEFFWGNLADKGVGGRTVVISKLEGARWKAVDRMNCC